MLGAAFESSVDCIPGSFQQMSQLDRKGTSKCPGYGYKEAVVLGVFLQWSSTLD
jgi:hypothetical protein